MRRKCVLEFSSSLLEQRCLLRLLYHSLVWERPLRPTALSQTMSERYAVATLGMFIIDDFQLDADQGQQALQSQVGGGGLYTALGARVWLVGSLSLSHLASHARTQHRVDV